MNTIPYPVDPELIEFYDDLVECIELSCQAYSTGTWTRPLYDICAGISAYIYNRGFKPGMCEYAHGDFRDDSFVVSVINELYDIVTVDAEENNLHYNSVDELKTELLAIIGKIGEEIYTD